MIETKAAKKVYSRPLALAEMQTHYCPGCGHGIIHRLVAEVIDELGLRGRTVGVAPVGCAIFASNYFNVDMVEAAHGRAPAVATGIKRTNPDHLVFAYQGDGDLAAIGMAETIHAAARGEPISIIFVNNAIYGMTGGQMAPTTLPGQKTTSSQQGRNVTRHGHPIRVPEMLATMDGPAYLVRTAVNNVSNVAKTKAAIKRAFRGQMEGIGYSMVEILSQCPTDWGLRPLEAIKWLEDNMLPYYPLGEFKAAPGIR